ncbi:MAG: hypothetical protein RIK87_26245 [Fuerstiella sp.]
MTESTTLSRNTLNDFVDHGDVLINFTSEGIAGGVPYVGTDAEGNLTVSKGLAWPITGVPDAAAVSTVLPPDVSRLVIVSDGGHRATDFAAALRTQNNVAGVVCVLEETCDADAFMDEDDAEAVAERLRQLGYI